MMKGKEEAIMQETRTPPTTDLQPQRRSLLISGRVVLAVAIAVTVVTAFTAFWYANTDFVQDIEAEVARYAIGFLTALAVIMWAGGLLLIRSSREVERPAWATPLIVLLAFVVVGAVVLVAVLTLTLTLA